MIRAGGTAVLLCAWIAAVSGAAAQSPAPDERRFDCVARPKAEVKLGSPEQGIIAAIEVDRGDAVEKGTVVARLDSELQALNVDLARLRAESDVEIRSSEARLAFRQAEGQRAQRLHERNVIPTTDLDEVMIEGRLAELAVETSRLEHQISQVEFARAKALYERRSVRSPVSGVVTGLATAVGEYVHDQMHIMRVAEIDPLHVEAYLPVSEFDRISVGMRAIVEMDEPIGGEHAAKVAVVDRVFDPESRTFGVRLDLPNPDFALPAGMICTVRFLGDDAVER